MFNKYRGVIFALTLSAGFLSQAQDRLSLLPPNLQGSARISNITTFFDRLKTSPVGQLWSDPQFQDAMGVSSDQSWGDFMFSELPEAEKELMVDQLKMHDGEFILGFSSDGDDEYTIAEMSAEDFNRSLEQDEKIKEFIENPFEIINDEFQGVKLVRHVRYGGTDDEESSWQAHYANTFVSGPSREWVERSIIQLKNTQPQEPEGAPVFNLNLKVSSLIQEVIHDAKENSPSAPGAPDKTVIFDALGLLGVETYTATLRLEENEMIMDNSLQVSDLTKGIFSLLDMQPSSLPSVNFISENISSIAVGRINMLGLWHEVPEILSAFSPEGKNQFDMIKAMIQPMTQIDLEQDLLMNLGTQTLSYSTTDPETKMQVTVTGIELKNSSAFKTKLETALNAPALQQQLAAMLEQEDFLEHTIYTLKKQNPNEALAFSVAADRLVYGPPDAIRRVIRTQNGTETSAHLFEQSPVVQGLREFAPAGAFSYRAIDWKEQMESIVKGIQNPMFTAGLMKGMGDSAASLPDMDFSKLPPSDHMASFFTISYEYTEQTPDGLHHRITTRY